MPTANEIRQQFIDFFCQKHGHTFVPSSPVVPFDDPTLLFTNAGMNQFKDVFLGTGTRPFKRAANTQKCIRAGGKHNDLDDVGKDTYHHTFFEMLGNWSFGDYFKREAIRWAWELLTDVWKIDKSRLHATVFEGDPDSGVPRDDEAAGFWKTETDIEQSHIHYGNKKDNFWEMGETGPCGPCTEIHIDLTPDKSGAKLVNQGTPDVIEIWNLVFIQFNRNADQSLTPLPAKHVDTGMGFERVTAVLQGKNSNYDTDVFAPLFAAIQDVCKAPPYCGKLDDLKDVAYRVIADHIRTLTFAIADLAVPSNEKRGYVLRSVLRRAVRYGWQQFGVKEPFLHKLVPAVVEHFGGAFAELKRDPAKVQKVIVDEETSFLHTLDRGLKLFRSAADEAKKKGGIISAKQAFDLHTEQGIFIDIVEQMAAEEKLRVDRAGYDKLFADFKDISGQGRKKFTVTAVKGDLPTTDDSSKYEEHERAKLKKLIPPRMMGHGSEPSQVELETIQQTARRGRVLGWLKDNTFVSEGSIKTNEQVALVLDETPFYSEQGGQVGDTGFIFSAHQYAVFQVEDTQRLGNTILHFGTLKAGSHLAVGQPVISSLTSREDVERNHTATHLLNLALRAALGNHIEQKGSLVDATKTRFDFSHDKPISDSEIALIEKQVNDGVFSDVSVNAVVLPLAEAKKISGVRAVFGEKYPDPVRVVMIGPDKPELVNQFVSAEFCGGTHVERTGSIGPFKIISQESVAKGVRRVTAITGRAALAEMQTRSATLDALAAKFQCPPAEVAARVEALQDELKQLRDQAKKGAAADLAGAVDKLLSGADVVIAGVIPAGGSDAIRAQVDRVRSKRGDCVVIFGWDDNGKPGLIVGVTDNLVKRGLHAGKLVGEAAKFVEGKGGGNPTLAQAGGKNAAKLGDAITHAASLARQALEKN